jgi:hypothetical protein
LVIFKFIAEMVNNRCSRLRFDTWNINGLIVFKEAAKITIRYLQITENLNNKVVRSDPFRERFKFIEAIMIIFQNCVTGHFINFAICEFYNDDTFTHLANGALHCMTLQEV